MTSLRNVWTLGLIAAAGLMAVPAMAHEGPVDLRTAIRALERNVCAMTDHLASETADECILTAVEDLHDSATHLKITASSRRVSRSHLCVDFRDVVSDYRILVKQLRTHHAPRCVAHDLIAVKEQLIVVGVLLEGRAPYLGHSHRHGHDGHHDEHEVYEQEGQYDDFPTQVVPQRNPLPPVRGPVYYSAPQPSIGLKLGKVQIQFGHR